VQLEEDFEGAVPCTRSMKFLNVFNMSQASIIRGRPRTEDNDDHEYKKSEGQERVGKRGT
jgi:hypothetical protein